MSFTTKRGRPKLFKRGADLGTPELVHKRAMHITAEAIDLMLERGLISKQQHWCAIHLRWLFTIRYGAATVRAVDPLHFGGVELKLDDPEWRREREVEFQDAILELGNTKTNMLLKLCIYNQRPRFLLPGNLLARQKLTNAKAEELSRELAAIKAGLEVLEGKWCKVKAHPAD